MREMKDRIFYLIIVLMLVATGAFGSLALVLPADQAQAQQFTACYEEFGGAKRVAGSGCEYEYQSGSVVDIQDGATFSIGTGLYPLGYASAGQEIVCARTSTFTGSTTITVSGLSTVTYVLPVQVTAPITTAAFLHHGEPVTTTFVLTSLDNAFGAGTTGVQAEYCAVGDK